MTMAVAWVVLPLLLAIVSLGCGLLLEIVSGMRLPGPLLLPGGFIVASLADQFAHMTNMTAPLQTPLVLVIALAGYALARPWKRFRPDLWLSAAVVGVYAVFAAPAVLSGSATFTGYIKLDDNAVYQSMLDRAASHSYNIHGIQAVSTYWRALQQGYIFGYPMGSFLPLGNMRQVVRVDSLWLWQPYLTFLAVLIALGLYQLVSGFVRRRALRATVAFIGTQAALIYGYALWGGVKELFVPVVVLFAASLVPMLGVERIPAPGATASFFRRFRDGTFLQGPRAQRLAPYVSLSRSVLPIAAASAAVLGGESVGGGVWIVPFAVGALILVLRRRRTADALFLAVAYTVIAVVLAYPMLSVSLHRLNHISKFTNGGSNGQGNLAGPLSWWQLPGVWLNGDFKFPPQNPLLTQLLALLVVAGAAFGVVVAWRRARWEIVVAFATAIVGCLVYVEEGSPWVAGKALAASSPIVLGVGLAGVAVLIEGKRQVEGGVALAALVAISAAVLWSNALQYHGVLLAPSSRLMELEKIGQKFAHQGPALLTEYEPYAARHFLRFLKAEEPSELRVNYDYLRDDSKGPKVCLATLPHCYAYQGVSPDLDELMLDGVVHYKLLIVRRSGSASRPPSDFRLVWSGHYYDVWKRTNQNAIISHMSLGSRFQPAAVPDCDDVKALALKAKSAGGHLVAVERPPATIIEADGAIGAPKFYNGYGEDPYNHRGTGKYKLFLPFHVKTAGTYTLWVGGSFSSTVTAKIDGNRIGRQSNQTEWPGNFLDFGNVTLAKGRHVLQINHAAPGWGPGSAAHQPFGLGPFVIAKGTENQRLTTVPVSRATSLCGKSLDWIEAVSG